MRGVSSDRLAVIGLVPASAGRLFVNLAHSSSGTSTAPLGAQLIDELCGGEFAPLTRDAIAALAPDRFLERQSRRGPRHGARAVSADAQSNAESTEAD